MIGDILAVCGQGGTFASMDWQLIWYSIVHLRLKVYLVLKQFKSSIGNKNGNHHGIRMLQKKELGMKRLQLTNF